MPGNKCSLVRVLFQLSPLPLFHLLLLAQRNLDGDINPAKSKRARNTASNTATGSAAAATERVSKENDLKEERETPIMAIYDIGETIVYRGADGSEAVGMIKSISDPLTDTISAMYEIEDVDTGDMSTIHESRILGSMDFDT